MFLIPLVVVLIIFCFYQLKNRNRFGAVSFLFSLYILMGLGSIVLYYYFDYDYFYHQVEVSPAIFLALCFCIVFYGLFSYSDSQKNVLLIENVRLLRWLESFQIGSSIGAIIFFLPFAFQALSGNILENRLGVSDTLESLGSFGLINSFASLVGNLFVLSIALAFVNLMTLGRGGSRFRAGVLIMLSSVYIVYVLAFVGRDGFVYWSLSFMFMYFIFRDYIPKNEKKMIVKLAALIATPALVTFVLITLSRFSDNTLLSLFDYAGSQVFNFNDQYRVDAPALLGLVNFSQYIHMGGYLFGIEPEILDKWEWFKYFDGTDVRPMRFATFIGAWYIDFKQLGTIIALLILSLLMRASLRRQARDGLFCFSTLLLFLLLSQIVLFGVFYYRQAPTAFTQIAIVLIALSFKVFRSKNKMCFIVKHSNFPSETFSKESSNVSNPPKNNRRIHP